MSAEAVLLRYCGGEVYALPTADRHVWRVAGIDVFVDVVETHAGTGEVCALETFGSLASAAKFQRFATDAAFRAGTVDAAIANAEAVLAKHERPKAKRTQERATTPKRTGKPKRRAKR